MCGYGGLPPPAVWLSEMVRQQVGFGFLPVRDRSWCIWRCHAVKVDDFKPKAGDLLHQPGEGGRVGQLGTEGGRVRACGDVAVVELCAQRFAGPAGESDLIRVWSHGIKPRSRWLTLPPAFLTAGSASSPGAG